MHLLYPASAEDTSFRKDDMTLHALKALGLPRLLSMEALDILQLLSADPAVLTWRQAIFADMKRIPVLYDILKKLRTYIADLRDLSRKRMEGGRSTEDVLYSFGELKVFIEMIGEMTAALENHWDDLHSEAMRSLFGSLKTIAEDEQFAVMQTYIDKIMASMRFPRSMTIGVNLNARFEVYEAGVVSINSEYYVGGGVFTSLFGKSEDELRCSTPLVSGESSAAFSGAIYSVLNDAAAKALKKSRSMMLSYIQNVVSGIYSIYEDLTFLLRAGEYIRETEEKKVRMCTPALVSPADGVMEIRRLVNPVLLRKLTIGQITANDVCFPEGAAIFLITGPNSGGKSVYLRSVGIAALTAQLGLPVTASEAALPLFAGICCHFPAEDSENDSRLVEECKSMKKSLDSLPPRTDSAGADQILLLMDESFSGTGSAEGAIIAEEVLKTIRSRRACCIYSTHLHELASRVPALNERTPRIVTLSAEYASGRRTYRIIPQEPGGRSYAYEIARTYGLEYTGD